MSSIGDALRQQRIQGRQSVAEAAGGSGLPKRVLIAFESGAVPLDDTQDLAHLRIYARYLGLDAEELLRSLRYRNGRPPVSHQRAGRRRVKQGKRPGDYGDTLTPGRQRLVNPAPASPISSPPAQPRGLTPPPSPRRLLPRRLLPRRGGGGPAWRFWGRSSSRSPPQRVWCCGTAWRRRASCLLCRLRSWIAPRSRRPTTAGDRPDHRHRA